MSLVNLLILNMHEIQPQHNFFILIPWECCATATIFKRKLFTLCCAISLCGIRQWWPAVPMASASDPEGGLVPWQVVQPPSL